MSLYNFRPLPPPKGEQAWKVSLGRKFTLNNNSDSSLNKGIGFLLLRGAKGEDSPSFNL